METLTLFTIAILLLYLIYSDIDYEANQKYMFYFLTEVQHLPPSVNHGTHNGYVAVPEGHPAYGRSYWEMTFDDDDKPVKKDKIQEAIESINVHGGLTWAKGIAHLSRNNFQDITSREEWQEIVDRDRRKYWVFGFDTCHYQDNRIAQNEEYVRSETISLFNQLKAITHERV